MYTCKNIFIKNNHCNLICNWYIISPLVCTYYIYQFHARIQYERQLFLRYIYNFFFLVSLLAYTSPYGKALRSCVSCVYIYEEIKSHPMIYINESQLPLFLTPLSPSSPPISVPLPYYLSLFTLWHSKTNLLLPAPLPSFLPTLPFQTTTSTHAPHPLWGAILLVSTASHTRRPCVPPQSLPLRISGICRRP